MDDYKINLDAASKDPHQVLSYCLIKAITLMFSCLSVICLSIHYSIPSSSLPCLRRLILRNDLVLYIIGIDVASQLHLASMRSAVSLATPCHS